MTKCQIGKYEIDAELLVWKDDKTAHIRDANHCGVMVKFPTGVPENGAPVMITSVLDSCWSRGKGNNRPGVKRVLRIKQIIPRDDRELYPIRVLPNDGSIRGWHLNADWVLATVHTEFSKFDSSAPGLPAAWMAMMDAT